MRLMGAPGFFLLLGQIRPPAAGAYIKYVLYAIIHSPCPCLYSYDRLSSSPNYATTTTELAPFVITLVPLPPTTYSNSIHGQHDSSRPVLPFLPLLFAVIRKHRVDKR